MAMNKKKTKSGEKSKKSYKVKLHIPVAQYGFFEIDGVEMEDAVRIYNRFAEKPLSDFPNAEPIKSFTGEIIYYDDKNHKYWDENGTPLVSCSQIHPDDFDLEKISKIVSNKSGVDQEKIKDMWANNSDISTGFGTVVHAVMEQYFKHKENGTDKDYHLPKHPVLRKIIDSFPDKDKNIQPEALISATKIGKVGRVDGLLWHSDKELSIIDYKTDAKIDKNLDKHFKQLSCYKDILEYHGYKIKSLIIYNFTNKWTAYEFKN